MEGGVLLQGATPVLRLSHLAFEYGLRSSSAHFMHVYGLCMHEHEVWLCEL